jgi:N-acetylglucosaminyldiphosphoundecaprenol N-acetyl-beta-D-mannosaminyltransferase
VQILNGRFDAYTLGSCVDDLVATVDQGGHGWLATVNVAFLMMMRKDPAVQNFVDRARWVVADGQPLLWLGKLLGRPLPERVTGVDLVDAICARAERDRLVVYFLGASTVIIDAAVEAVRRKYPALQLHYADGYFSDEEASMRARAVAEVGTDFLIVGMGVPRQEAFTEKFWDELKVNVAVGVGGSFDVIGGLRRRAPGWMQTCGLEWTYRLLQEPGRLWRRYLVTNVQFTMLAIRAFATERILGPSHRPRSKKV